MQRAIVLIDGEHYPQVTAEALRQISSDFDVVGAVCLGGTEKLACGSPLEVLGVPIVMGLDQLQAVEQAISLYRPHRVIDLSDEPVLDYPKRFAIAARVLALGVTYSGADFVFTAPSDTVSISKPSVSIIGTGKRVGKTGISGFTARTLSREFSPIVVTLGRGGPAEPEVVYGRQVEITVGYLLSLSVQGRHASSDHLENALTSHVTTIGGRRCGGGLAGQAYVSNVDRCAQLADAIPGNIVLFEGSGSAIPNVATDRRILVVSAHQPLDTIAQYLGPLRIINSHLVVLTMCEEPIASEHGIRAMEDAIRATNPRARIVRTIFRPRPLSDVQGKRVVLCTTSSDAALPLMTRHLEEAFGCSVVASTNRLSNRSALQADLAGFGHRGAHLVLTELKAAAVDVATSWGIANGLDVAYMDNEPLPASSQYSLQEEILALARQAVEQHSRIHSAASCVD